jgi:PST family polysaccharide transporter
MTTSRPESPRSRPAEPGGLRQRTASGGAYLVVRQVVGTVIRFGGLLVLTRIIGPEDFGVYAASLAIIGVVAAVCRLGTEVYLIRYVGERLQDAEDQAFSLLLVASLAIVAVGVPTALAVGDRLAVSAGLVTAVMVASLPVNVLWVPAQARLERELQYRRLALVELGGDLTLYAVALPLAALGAGVWAAVAGYVAWQSWLLVGSGVAARYRPRWCWEADLRRSLLRWGLTYSPSFWAFQARQLVNPVVVGRYIGSAGVGQVALALRLADNAGLLQRAAARLALPALARVQDDRRRLERAHSEAMVVKVLGGGLPLLVLVLAGPSLIPAVFGDEWSDVSKVLPLIGVSLMLEAPLSLHVSVLHVFGRNNLVTAARGAFLIVFFGAAFALVPPLGITGYGWAAIVAVVPMLMLDPAVRPLLTPRYGPAVRWLIGLTPPMFIPVIGHPAALLLLVPTVVVVLLPRSRAELAEYARLLARR